MGAIEQYRRELYRIAWRMQYREKRDLKREVSMKCSPDLFQPSFAEESDNKIVLQSYINVRFSIGIYWGVATCPGMPSVI
ncbi:hypothetical protein [Paenibacillus polymyxa]|uniref:hypothetical protein n=1 Tax=Paenibacillus polymyxa TaxID=1406 RepID=UPI0004707210|nr:hypothetical protein [Paenibacillus polymyxa]